MLKWLVANPGAPLRPRAYFEKATRDIDRRLKAMPISKA
jgi:hypothetical protein